MTYSQKKYDTTMRIAFIVAIDDSVARFLPLVSFWDLPAKPMSEGQLREHTISHIKFGKIITVDASAAD